MSQKEMEAEGRRKLQKATEMNFDPSTKTHEELRDFFKITEGAEPVKDMNVKMFESTMQRMKVSQNLFYAFLNKQFNIMNFKSSRCSMHCFDTPTRSLNEVGGCLSTCR